jgi:hypothetical protein
MTRTERRAIPAHTTGLLVLLVLLWCGEARAADNQVLGEVQLEGASKVEQTSGVWVDGQYLGFVKELKGSKKILLLPGEHTIVARQGGYLDFTQKITVGPGQKQLVRIVMAKNPQLQTPAVTAEIKMDVKPDRAAVFVDGLYIGHVAEFDGIGKALLVAPGKRKITLSLPGYEPFETTIDLAPKQKFKLKTELVKAGT